MRSQALFRRSKPLFNALAAVHPHPAVSPSSRSLRPLRKEQSPRVTSRVSSKRLSSSTAPTSATEAASPASEPPEGASNGPPGTNDGSELTPDGSEKPKTRRTRVATTATKDPEPIELPESLDILWTPHGDAEPNDSDTLYTSALPPPEILDDALNNLLITLHPQTQHRAAYASPLGPQIEPTLALYCPIEGGEYIIDTTVRELARRTGAEVVVLDAVQLAAGEWGHFGKAANSLSLPRNPLHFPSSPPSATPTNSRAYVVDEDEEGETPSSMYSQFPQPQQMTLTVMTPPTMQGRAIITSSPRRNVPPSKIKVFFDTLVDTPSKVDTSGVLPTSSRPRLIYIRDFPTLAPSSSAWYPPLLSAVRERRRGPIARPTSPVGNPTTIIFGMTPSLTPPVPRNSPNNGLMSVLMSRAPSAAQVTSEPKPGRSEWGEDEAAEKAREKRLRDKLRKWEKGDAALHDELHKLSANMEGDTSEERPEIIVIGGPNGMSGFPSLLSAGVPASSGGRSEPENDSSFFRTSILVPRTRSVAEERAVRMARRREINELTMRMGVGAAGGTLERKSAAVVHASSHLSADGDAENKDTASRSDHERMWEDWGTRVEVWSNVRRISDRAIGNTMSASRISGKMEKTTLDPTVVSWSAVHKAWAADRSTKDLRKSWLKEASFVSKPLRERDEGEEDKDEESLEKPDEVIERVKNDSELDSHEQRLLSCIVDSASMPTSFSQVHLPPHTIDSVRTIVSLPLLHPQAFQQGILKEHGMTGCLLFGPPGTGKTLVVRALAKEAGCRMMTISPSDVMDMYVGEGEKLVKAVFSLARRLSPCVVFLDEIDALFGARMSARESGGAFAHRGVITEFMQEMDGLKTSKEDSVIVIGATNRPFDLDDAVLRRLPRRLLVDLPGEKEREEILKILLRDEPLAKDLDIRALAKKTESFSGSDLKHLCVSAALDAVKEHVLLPWSTQPSLEAAPVVHSTVIESQPLAPLPTTDAAAPLPDLSEDLPTSEIPATFTSPTDSSIPEIPANSKPELHTRVLHLHNFTKALKEITPSSSEALGSLAELRKWNEEFGEGRRDRKRQQVWGKGRFGFTDKTNQGEEDGRVLHSLKELSSTDVAEM